MVLKMLITKNTVPTMTMAMPTMKKVPPQTLNCVKSAGNGQ